MHAFKSQLQNHCLSHKHTKDFACIWPNCGKRYFSKEELTKHVNIHYKDCYFRDICDDYSTYDSHLLISHKHKHSKIKTYECDKCGEKLPYTTAAAYNRKKV